LLLNLAILDARQEQTSEDDPHVDQEHDDNEGDKGYAEERVLRVSYEVDRVQTAEEYTDLIELLQSKRDSRSQRLLSDQEEEVSEAQQAKQLILEARVVSCEEDGQHKSDSPDHKYRVVVQRATFVLSQPFPQTLELPVKLEFVFHERRFRGFLGELYKSRARVRR